MKTAVIMKRELSGIEIRQNHLTGMLSATDLNKAFNSLGQKKKQLNSYFENESTDELIDELCRVNGVEKDSVKHVVRGNRGGTWVCPELFVDLAMWHSVKFRATALKWVVDGLLGARDNSGESYKLMTKAIALNFNPENPPLTYARIAQQIALACKVGSSSDKWQTATQSQLELRDKIQTTIATIAEFCQSPGDCTSRAINKSLNFNKLQQREN